MAKSEKINRVEAHLSSEEISDFTLIANERGWSKKRLNEYVIRWYLEENKSIIAQLRKRKKLDK